MYKKLSRVFALIWIVISLPTLVSAQSNALAALSSPDLQEFPRISAYLDVRDSQGYFISNLQKENISVEEDGASLYATELTEIRPGAQIVVAINPGVNFTMRNAQGVSRYESISLALKAWISSLGEENIDILSLVTPDGILASHQSDPHTWNNALQDYQPDFSMANPGAGLLSQALDVALDPLPNPGMGRAVLFVTPALPLESADVLQSLADRAIQGNVRIYVAMLDSPDFFDSPFAQQLQSMSALTGGQFFAFSGSEPLPDLNTLFESARRSYYLVYNSRINTAGQHQFSVTVQAPQGKIAASPLTIEIELRPPNPVFVSPPNQILRSVPVNSTMSMDNLMPQEQTIEVLFDFPDTIQRQIVNSVLYVNDEIVAENTSPPFEFFTLDLEYYLASELLMLRVEATDELGLTGSSIDTPLQITVQSTKNDLATLMGRHGAMLALLTALFAGLVLMLILVIAGRLRPRRLGERWHKRAVYQDPVTQPLKQIENQHNEDTAAASNLLSRFSRRLPAANIHWPQRQEKTEPYAYLLRVGEEGEPLAAILISITTQETTFGADPKRATITIDDPAIESLHARLWRDDEGSFYIADNNSTAGTWINFAPVSADGCRVENGDLIHIAKAGFRFSRNRPTNPRRPKVTKLEELE